MRVLDELEREIERVAAREGDVKRRRRWWRPGVALVVLPLTVGAVAVAATSGVLSGEPMQNPPGPHPNPKSGLGVVVGQGKLLGAHAADPDGGPEWGVRMVKTSRGLGCLQLGRLVDGKLGVLGRDGSFGNDGKFHETRPDVLPPGGCQQPDAAGHLFIAMTWIGLPASGNGAGCAVRHFKANTLPLCQPESLRTVYFGLLGPQGRAVTYVGADGKVVRQPASGPDGAYLVVLRTKPGRNTGYFSPGVTPANGLRSVEYRDGSVCHIRNARRLGGARACPLKGFVEPRLPAVTHADLATTIRVHVGKRPAHPWRKLKQPKGAPPVPAQRRVTLAFRARHAANARSFYTVSTRMLHGGKGCTYMTMGPIARDLAAGTVVTQKLYFPYRCHATVQIDVGYTQQRRPSSMPFMPDGFPNAKVGRVFAKLG